MTYAELVTAIQDYTAVDEASFVANIPNFVQNTEVLINNSVQLPAFRKNVVNTTTASYQYMDLPTDFLSVFSLAYVDGSGNYYYLLPKDVNYLREVYPFPQTTGAPQFYGLWDADTLILAPTPDTTYTVELHYYAYPTSIVTAGTSWIGDNFPNALLWGALHESYVYLKGEPDLIQLYQSKFQEVMTEIKNLGDARAKRDNYRNNEVRYDPK